MHRISVTFLGQRFLTLVNQCYWNSGTGNDNISVGPIESTNVIQDIVSLESLNMERGSNICVKFYISGRFSP